MANSNPAAVISYLIKADNVNSPTDVNVTRAYAVDLGLFETMHGEHNTDCHGGWKGGVNSNRDNIKCPSYDMSCFRSTKRLEENGQKMKQYNVPGFVLK
jgi:hypothetical protein